MAGVFEIENTDSDFMENPGFDLYPIVKFNNLDLPTIFDDSLSKNYLDCKIENVFEDSRCLDQVCDKIWSVRTDRSIPSCCGLYYFELKILNDTIMGSVGLGFSSSKFSIDKQLGMGSSSVGLMLTGRQAVNLHMVNGRQQGIPLESKMRVHHLGIGINFLEGHIFCTVNGIMLLQQQELPTKDKFPTILKSTRNGCIDLENVYPVVSSQSPKCRFSVNLGVNPKTPFCFDFKHYKASQLRKKRTQCLSQEYSPKLAFVTVHSLVSDYLLHHGYAEAWASLHKYDQLPGGNSGQQQSVDTVRNRRSIQTAIVQKDYLAAVRSIDTHFPDFFNIFPIYRFILKCRHFINLIVTQPLMINGNSAAAAVAADEITEQQQQIVSDDFVKSAKSARLDPVLLLKQHKQHQQPRTRKEPPCGDTVQSPSQRCHIGMDTDETVGGAFSVEDDDEDTNDVTKSYRCQLPSSTEEDEQQWEHEQDQEMRDQDNEINHNSGTLCRSPLKPAFNSSSFCKSQAADGISNGFTGEHVMQIIQYGKSLKEEAQTFYASLDTSPEYQRGIDLLTIAFSLIAYRDPYNSPFKDILSLGERENLAYRINGAINGMLGRTTQARLDCILETCLTETRLKSNPILSAIHPQLLVSELHINNRKW